MDLTTQHKLDTLTMELSDWTKLEKELKAGGRAKDYRSIVLSYQRREDAVRPICDALFGTCRYCGFGFKCGFKGPCSKKRRAA